MLTVDNILRLIVFHRKINSQLFITNLTEIL